jgi:signal transduction histidine kinase
METRFAERFATARVWAFDVAVAAALTALSLSIFASIANRVERPAPAVAVTLLVVHCASLTWRRRAPLAVMGLNLVSGAVLVAIGYPVVMLGLASVVVLYTVASRSRRAPALAALGATVAAMAAALVLPASRADASTIAGNAVVLTVVWFLGDSHRSRREYVARLEERTAELERARDDLARTAVAEERLRIARELHDVLAHSMGMIAVQAGVGAHVIDSRPDDAKQSLAAIEQASKSALGEIRRMLGLLRSPEEPAATRPSPGLADLPQLAEETGRTGLDVELRVDPPREPLSPGIELAIYRIVQEAVTNVVRHAGAGHALVSVTFDEDAARVAVVDDGPAASADPTEGHGIAGMRERVAIHRGTFEAGAVPGGGFRVAASIPLEGGAG